jgi:hypothetical protein
MTTIDTTPLAALDADKRLLSPVYKGPLGATGRFGFRGELALRFAQQYSDEARPPEVKADQVMTVADAGATTIPFFAGFVASLAHLELVCDVLGERLAADGRYFLFAGNLDISSRYRIPCGGATWHVLPLDEATFRRTLSPADMVRTRVGPGGPQPAETRRMLGESRKVLAADRAWVEARRDALAAAEAELNNAFGALLQR